MKKLIQTKLHDPSNGVRGNCMMTTYASYFDLEINDVPPIEEFFETGPQGFWYQAFELWLNNYMYHKEIWHKEDPSISGYTDYYFAVGPSSRGCFHQVIYKDGILYHDPHPSQEGLLLIDHFLTLEKI